MLVVPPGSGIVHQVSLDLNGKFLHCCYVFWLLSNSQPFLFIFRSILSTLAVLFSTQMAFSTLTV
jgi:hypothetical protein